MDRGLSLIGIKDLIKINRRMSFWEQVKSWQKWWSH